MRGVELQDSQQLHCRCARTYQSLCSFTCTITCFIWQEVPAGSLLTSLLNTHTAHVYVSTGVSLFGECLSPFLLSLYLSLCLSLSTHSTLSFYIVSTCSFICLDQGPIMSGFSSRPLQINWTNVLFYYIYVSSISYVLR
jgi:hypothetical protein